MEKPVMQYSTVDEYIQLFPKEVRKKLVEIRRIIRREAPNAEERISYRMPAFFLNGALVYYAAFAKHIGFYPTASGIRAFKNKISRYKNSKGAVQFPMDEPLPAALIRQIARFRVAENLKKGTK